MKIDPKSKILIIGLGLLGGSYAMALKKQGYTVWGITRKEQTINYALEHNLIDKGTTAIDAELIGAADIIVFALYPHIFIDWVNQNGHLIKENTIVTDVTGVKQSVVYEIQRLLPSGVEFISAHPMAGRETAGIEYSDDGIFSGANYIVVPTD